MKKTEFVCQRCGDMFIDWPSRLRKYCGIKCKQKAWGKMFGGLLKNTIYKECLNCQRTYSPVSPSDKRSYCSLECRKIGMRQLYTGEGSPTWQGGKTPIVKRIRNSRQYQDWREGVFKRDDYTCQECKQRGGDLNADHDKPVWVFPELVFSLDNGRTLCVDCHKRKTKLDIWLKNKIIKSSNEQKGYYV